uniref:Uncharacterized protein n=1 Tax=Heterorhabditis bacteriophora TaxID=37862 RepID=A0A1I7XEC0_HETBA
MLLTRNGYVVPSYPKYTVSVSRARIGDMSATPVVLRLDLVKTSAIRSTYYEKLISKEINVIITELA